MDTATTTQPNGGHVNGNGSGDGESVFIALAELDWPTQASPPVRNAWCDRELDAVKVLIESLTKVVQWHGGKLAEAQLAQAEAYKKKLEKAIKLLNYELFVWLYPLRTYTLDGWLFAMANFLSEGALEELHIKLSHLPGVCRKIPEGCINEGLADNLAADISDKGDKYGRKAKAALEHLLAMGLVVEAAGKIIHTRVDYER